LLSGTEFDVQIVVRRWVDLEQEFEFRCFVVDDKINCITQYYPLCFVPKMVQIKDKLKDHLFNYFESIKEQIKISNYTIDFAVLSDLSKTWIIELNHPPPTAGTCLYNWENQLDRKIMAEGPYELRIQEKPVQQPLDKIHPPLKELLLDIKMKRATIHKGFKCDACHGGIVGIRFSCKNCVDSYDLCEACAKIRNPHTEGHQFYQLGIRGAVQRSSPEDPKEDETCLVS